MANWELEERVCVHEGCRNAFRVLPASRQRHCSIPHSPDGPRTYEAAARAAGKKKALEKKSKRDRLVKRVRELYASGHTTRQVVEILNAAGFAKSKKGHRIDDKYVAMLRWKYKIRVSASPKGR